jgi:hypothetical protein
MARDEGMCLRDACIISDNYHFYYDLPAQFRFEEASRASRHAALDLFVMHYMFATHYPLPAGALSRKI